MSAELGILDCAECYPMTDRPPNHQINEPLEGAVGLYTLYGSKDRKWRRIQCDQCGWSRVMAAEGWVDINLKEAHRHHRHRTSKDAREPSEE